jgi:cytochrome c biogenesis protein CcdA
MSFKMTFRKSWNKLRFYLSFLLLAFYLVVGGTFLFTQTWSDLIPKGRAVIGIVLILFGTLRFYIAYRRYINKLARLNPSPIPKEEENANAGS